MDDVPIGLQASTMHGIFSSTPVIVLEWRESEKNKVGDDFSGNIRKVFVHHYMCVHQPSVYHLRLAGTKRRTKNIGTGNMKLIYMHWHMGRCLHSLRVNIFV